MPREPKDLSPSLRGTRQTSRSVQRRRGCGAIDMAVTIMARFACSRRHRRLHPETYQFPTRSGRTTALVTIFPQPEAIQALCGKRGRSLLQRRPLKSAGIRKVEPLTRALKPLRAWVTGQRKDQSPSTRIDVPVIQLDRTFGSPDRPLVKFNPLSTWTSKQVWAYIREHDVPYNALHDRGFVSIGCEPCTRPVHPGQHEREGRWWWEEETKKECGLHVVKAT
jgi:phosphoadenosine phosphosulfate reductase